MEGMVGTTPRAASRRLDDLLRAAVISEVTPWSSVASAPVAHLLARCVDTRDLDCCLNSNEAAHPDVDGVIPLRQHAARARGLQPLREQDPGRRGLRQG
jgi:hypothetical protein